MNYRLVALAGASLLAFTLAAAAQESGGATSGGATSSAPAAPPMQPPPPPPPPPPAPAPMAQAMVQGWYVSGGAGIDWQDNVKEDSTFVGDATFPSGNAAIVAGAFGYRFPDRIRVEGEFAWDRHDLGDAVISAETFNGHVSTWSLMANVAYDFKLGPRWDYTVGAGAGIGNADVSLSGNFGDGSSGSNQGFMWQGFTGIDYWVCDNMTLNVDWRYRELAANDAYDFDSVIPYHLKALHDTALLFSVRWYPWAQ